MAGKDIWPWQPSMSDRPTAPLLESHPHAVDIFIAEAKESWPEPCSPISPTWAILGEWAIVGGCGRVAAEMGAAKSIGPTPCPARCAFHATGQSHAQTHAQTHALQTHGDRAIATPARAPMKSPSEMQEEPSAESMQKSREKEGPSSGSMQKSMEEEEPCAGSKQKCMGQGEPSAPAKSMEEWEDETFKALSRNHKKPSPKAKAKAKAQAKKPHGKAASAKPSPKAKAKAKGKAKAKAKANKGDAAAVYGCPRCRGNPLGCPTCKNPSYNGIAFPAEKHGKPT